jgi:uncharacterized membrane protein YbhN (UPF0104 family)
METPATAPPKPTRSRAAQIFGVLIRVAATVALMAYALRGVAWGEFRSLLEHADWRWWIVGQTVGVASQVVGGVRWAALARPLGFALSRGSFVWRFFEGSFFSLCLPSSIGGDVVKAYRLGDSTPRRLLAACSVLADRLTGVSALGVLAVTALLVTRLGLGPIATLAVAAVLLGCAMLVFRLAVGSIDRILGLLREGSSAREFVARLLPYQQRPSLMSQALAWSLIVQMGGAMTVAFLARSLGIVQPLTVWFIVVPLVSLAIVLPVSINGIGLRESALVTLLAPYGVAREPAVAVGLLWLTSQVIMGLIGGVLFLLARRAVSAATSAGDERR